MPLVISVIICTHNPRPDYLSRVLAALSGQTLPHDHWELLVIDNASKDSVATRFDIAWHPHGRHIREDELGLTPARLRGIAESKADLLVFVDDDNVLDPNYLEHANRIAKEWPQLGTWGGQCVAEYEVLPPDHLLPHMYGLALRTTDRDYWTNLPGWSKAYPFGAGLCVRQAVVAAYRDQLVSNPIRLGLDRSGKGLGSSGDYDLNWTACEIGYGCGVFRCLHLMHLIPANRVSDDYVLELIQGHEHSCLLVGLIHGETPPLLQNSTSHRILNWLRSLRLSKFDRRVHAAREAGRRTGQERWMKRHAEFVDSSL